MSGILVVARACMTLLGPMTGTGATGNLTATSTGATGSVPKNSYARAVVNGQRSKHVLLKVTETTAVTSSGTSVPVKAIFGNLAGNLAAGTTVRWDPPVTGISATATVAAPGLAGAAEATGRGSAKEIVFYEDIRTAGEDLFKSGVGRFPALVLCWEESRDRDELGRRIDVLEEQYVLFVITSRKDDHESRQGEGLDILEEATERLFRRESCDGSKFTSPAPLLIRRRGRLAYSPDHYIYWVRFTVDRSVTRREPSDAADWTGWALWEQTRIDVDTDTGTPPEVPIVDDAKHENTV